MLQTLDERWQKIAVYVQYFQTFRQGGAEIHAAGHGGVRKSFNALMHACTLRYEFSEDFEGLHAYQGAVKIENEADSCRHAWQCKCVRSHMVH